LILTLESQGKIFEDQEHIRGAFQEHFKNLYGSNNEQQWPGYIPHSQNQLPCGMDKLTEMGMPLSEDKIKTTVWSFGADNAPGPNDFSMFFYHKFWDIIKPDIIILLDCFHQRPYS